MRSRNLLLLIVLIASGALAQETLDFRTSDSLTLRMLAFPVHSNQFLQPPFAGLHSPVDSATVRLYPHAFFRNQLLLIPSTVSQSFELTSSLRLESTIDHRYEFLRTTLSAFLVGGEAYMIYRAMKKYGYIR